jgi:D-sedoheptulose 7-phosphate isomerase
MLQVEVTNAHPTATEYLAQLARVLEQVPVMALERAIDLIMDARAANRRVYVMGNGGSSATASHFVCDLVKTARVPTHAPIKAFSLSDNTPLLTAWSNDQAYECVFAESIDAVVEPGDVVIAISASGNSRNIVRGLEAAASKRARTIALLGFDGGMASELAEVVVHIPCDDYGLVEDCHSALGHAITKALRTRLLALNA